VWEVGNYGSVSHYDGHAWTTTSVTELVNLSDVWGTGPNDVWTVGAGFGQATTFFHYDGQTWTPTIMEETNLIQELWGSGPRDVWAVGKAAGRPLVYHYDGISWTESPTGVEGGIDLFGVWGSGPGDVWAVGAGGLILHHDGTTWTRVASGTTGILTSVWGSGPGDVWAVGDGGVVVHHDGSAWSSYDLASTSTLLRVRGAAATDVWIAGLDSLHHLGSPLPTLDGGVCTAPLDLRCGSTVYGSVTAAAPAPRHRCGRDEAREVVYRVDSPVSGHVTLSLDGHGGDVDLAVLGADAAHGCAPGTCLAIGQGPEATEVVRLPTQPEQTIYVTVDAPTAAAVAYTLRIRCDKE
jgi:hypothetical protein